MDWKISEKPKAKTTLSVSDMFSYANVGKKFNMEETNFFYVVMPFRSEYGADESLAVLCFTRLNPYNFKILTKESFNPTSDPRFIRVDDCEITATF